MPGRTIGGNSNVNDGTDSRDEVVLSDLIALNSTTSTVVLAANDKRINFTLSNESSKQIWLKFQPAADDNDKKGIVVFARSVFEMTPDSMYTGEISAIAESGTPNVFITEY